MELSIGLLLVFLSIETIVTIVVQVAVIGWVIYQVKQIPEGGDFLSLIGYIFVGMLITVVAWIVYWVIFR